MKIGLVSWLGFKNSEEGKLDSPSIFKRLNFWNSSGSNMGKNDSKRNKTQNKKETSRKIIKSLEIDDEPDDNDSSTNKLTNSKNKLLRKNSNKKRKNITSKEECSSITNTESLDESIDLNDEEKNEIIDQLKGQLKVAQMYQDDDISYQEYLELLEEFSVCIVKSKKRKNISKNEVNNLQPPKKKAKVTSSKVKSTDASSSRIQKKSARAVISTDDDEDNIAFCLICEESDDIPLIQCGVCEYRFHAECIDLKLPLSYPIENWRCFDCINCSKCKEYIDDPSNIQCIKCGKTYHGKCKPDGTVSIYPFKSWYCMECIKHIRENNLILQQQGKIIQKKELKLDIKKSEKISDTLTNLPHWRELTNVSYFFKTLPLENVNNIVKPKVCPLKQTVIEIEMKNQTLRILNKKLDEYMLNIAKKEDEFYDEKVKNTSDILTEEGRNKLVKRNGKLQPLLLQYQRLWPNKEYMNNLMQSPTKSPSKIESKNLSKTKTLKESLYSINKNQLTKASNKKTNKEKNDNKEFDSKMKEYLYNFSIPEIVNDYMDIRQKSFMIKEKEEKILKNWIRSLHFDDSIVQYLHMGNDHLIPVSKYIPSNDPNMSYSKLVFVCHKCFTLFLSGYEFNIHLKMCEFTHPPGNEIYREDIILPKGIHKCISFFEIVGVKHVDYCRRLCTVASALLTAKAVTQEVDLFKFYILTEFHEEWGYIPAGFFSKEKKPSQNNNLSCLLVFNQYRQSGYGKLLVDLSYTLSKEEKKYGSPEHPLSDDGLYLYRSYWKSVIFEYIRQHRNSKKISFEEISKETHIYVDDIVSTLLVNGMIKQNDDGKIVIDCVKPWFTDIKILRRRIIDDSKLKWKPDFDIESETHNEYYVCDSSDEEC